MAIRSAAVRFESALASIDDVLAGIDAAIAARYPAIERLRADLAAAMFHLRRPKDLPPLLAILGGTGTGKSTLLNRLTDSTLAATSFRRTYTAGPIAVTCNASHIPPGWLGIAHEVADTAHLPVRGRPDVLSVVLHRHPLTEHVTLIDTPDLDGDQPAHHAQADRVFRWADAVLFLVTPEKYQMTELLPYYRLARRYGLPALHVMNKAQEQPEVDDYAAQLGQDCCVFAIPRDDAAYEPPAHQNLQSLRSAITSLRIGPRQQANALRAADLMDRLRDQVIEPLKADRSEADTLVASLRAMEMPAPGVDVNPLTIQLQRRLQQRSVLYLMGPGRVLDRVRQVPGMLARLPRTTWDWLRTGRIGTDGGDDLPPDLSRENPNFARALVDQFTVVQSRIDDVVRLGSRSAQWIEQAAETYAKTRLPVELAGAIAAEEIAALQRWLENHWNATPRDTAVLEKLLKVVPGGKQLTRWSEAAPYILAIVVATHGAMFGPIDLLILGGWSLATWLSEKLSNEVAARARAANHAIATRFTELAHRQIEQTCAWLDAQAVPGKTIARLESLADTVSEAAQATSSVAVAATSPAED
ncbi:GTPase [Fontivita pretiosa]|uniref:GTPase n=1 Tax=Fontivita pretiosa TaxID=2989684 RepID=UPI003D17EB80